MGAATDPERAPDAPPSAPPASRRRRSQLLVALLCALLGFALVVQVRQNQGEEFATMRQDDLVQLLDEITTRNDQLEAEQAQLISDRNDLLSGADAREVAERNAQEQAILAGTVPVQGPGIEVKVRAGSTPPTASTWVNLVEELRNAGAEAIEVDGIRVGVSSSFEDTDDGVTLDGTVLGERLSVLAIGDPQTLEVALGIPGGALATFRSQDATTEVNRPDLVEIRSTRALQAPSIATPAPSPTAG